MTPRQFSDCRQATGLGRRAFGRLLGYEGSPRNIWATVHRYETGKRTVPPTIARLAQLLVWYQDDFGYLPDLDNGRREPMEMPPGFEIDQFS